MRKFWFETFVTFKKNFAECNSWSNVQTLIKQANNFFIMCLNIILNLNYYLDEVSNWHSILIGHTRLWREWSEGAIESASIKTKNLPVMVAEALINSSTWCSFRTLFFKSSVQFAHRWYLPWCSHIIMKLIFPKWFIKI